MVARVAAAVLVASAGAGECRWRRPCPSPVARVAVFPAQPAAVALVNAGNLARFGGQGCRRRLRDRPAPERVNVAGVGLARLRWPGLPCFRPNPPRCPGERWEPCPFRWPGLPPASPVAAAVLVASAGAGECRWRRPCPSMVAKGCRVSSPTRRRCPGERSESGLFRWPALPPPSMVASAGAGECRWRRPCPSMVARVAVFSAQPAAVALVNAGNLARRWWPGLPPPSWWPAPERVNIAGVGLARRWWPRVAAAVSGGQRRSG